jgi:hypothetical protein
VAPAHRNRGVSWVLLAAAVAIARSHGATSVEAYPSPPDAGRSAFDFCGSPRLFTDAGFALLESPLPHYSRVVLEL